MSYDSVKLPPGRPREKALEYLRATGVNGWTDPVPVRERIESLHSGRGIPLAVIAARSGVDLVVIKQHRQGYRYKGGEKIPVRHVTKDVERRILGARFTPADGYFYPVAGIRRRLQALQADGYILPVLAEQTGFTFNHIYKIQFGKAGKTFVTAAFAQAVVSVYDRLSVSHPSDWGVSEQSRKFARTRAEKKGYAPSRCWDPDTIDEPEAIPEWTGCCGTPYGWYVHEDEGIPPCRPCLDARGPRRRRSVPTFSPEKFQQTRIRAGLTMVALARDIGADAATIKHWESGRSRPKPGGKLAQAMSVLDVTYEEICE